MSPLSLNTPNPRAAVGAMLLAQGVTRDYLLHHRVCPVEWDANGKLRIAASSDALLEDAIPDLEQAYGCGVFAMPAADAHVSNLIERLTTRVDQEASPTIELARAADAGDEHTTDVRGLAAQPPVVRYVNLLVRDAYDASASDIHLEATKRGLIARLRLDGVLTRTIEPPEELAHAVVSRLKLLAELDIAERRRPQDGRIRVRLESRELDLRVSTVPTLFGESVVLRLLDRGGRPVSLPDLGMPATVLAGITQITARPNGMVLVTGPTGSGKTTTLYAALQQRDTGAEKIITVEDPVEYELAGITQVPVHRHAGVTFAAALRSILRQDPDVIMLGEMRDPETAEVAVQAAMTGHLVFSTVHTNDALSAFPRLVDLGVPPYLLAATIEGVLAQRLVRVVCDQCRTIDHPAPALLAAARPAATDGFDGSPDTPESSPTFARGAGCPVCRHTGYRGRAGLFELALMTDELRGAIAASAPLSELRLIASRGGMRSMVADGWTKATAGITTIEEVLHATQH
jgi:general secretion pathway protein E